MKKLVKAAEKCADAQVEEHNTGKDSSASVAAFEKYAKKMGFACCWYGLYPTLIKDGREFHLPD